MARLQPPGTHPSPVSTPQSDQCHVILRTCYALLTHSFSPITHIYVHLRASFFPAPQSQPPHSSIPRRPGSACVLTPAGSRFPFSSCFSPFVSRFGTRLQNSPQENSQTAKRLKCSHFLAISAFLGGYSAVLQLPLGFRISSLALRAEIHHSITPFFILGKLSKTE